jgi:hypothetical protein
LENGTVAAVARGSDGVWHSSDRGVRELTVDRTGWVRIAIPRSRGATEAGFVCMAVKPAEGRCRVEIGRVFSLGDDYRPGPQRGGGTFDLQAGEMRAVALRPGE